jgi:tRNA pseudouridine55 synthase
MTARGSLDCGIILIDKPAGPTSHDIVRDLRRRLSQRAGRRIKTGHAGTLDPFATGLLVLLVGRATRLQRYLQHQPKRYLATARLGWLSDSGDSDGVLTHSGVIPDDPQLPVGELALPVPRLSAIKVGGERLYAKTRRGEDFEPPVRTMTVYRAERMSLSPDTAVFEVDCAGGTYIRSVVASLSDAYCAELRRTRVGELSVEDADEEVILDPLAVLSHLEAIELTADQAGALIAGRRPVIEAEDAYPLRLVHDNRLIGVGAVDAGHLKAETILAGSLEELLER